MSSSSRKKFRHSTTFYRKVHRYVSNVKTQQLNDNVKYQEQIENVETQQQIDLHEVRQDSDDEGIITPSTNIVPLTCLTALNQNNVGQNISIDDNQITDSDSTISEVSDTSNTDRSNKNYHKLIDSVESKKILREWALKFLITHRAINELLEGLSIIGIPDLPKDSRTLLQTPRRVEIIKIGDGEYWHNGLTEVLTGVLNNLKKTPTEIALNFNMDGLPISRSSRDEFWPILCNIAGMPNIAPMTIGIYYGKGKPSNVNKFLMPFVNEISEILEQGILINLATVSVKINCFICDTPARALIKGNYSK